jgi:hypothetical protein
MELVEQDATDPGQRRVALRLTQEHALSHEPDARARPDRALEARLEPDFLAQLAPELLRHAARRHARRKPPGLEHDDLPVDDPRAQHDLRDLRGLAASGGRREHHAPAAHRADDLLRRPEHGQVGGWLGSVRSAHSAQYPRTVTVP